MEVLNISGIFICSNGGLFKLLTAVIENYSRLSGHELAFNGFTLKFSLFDFDF